jgi:ABC-type Fe3+/spermidine/putrescine transport system ATPase subunit
MIRTKEISFSIGTFELKRLSIDIAKGEYFILLGPPGSGKTIFLECLCGLKKIQSGKILIDGRDVTSLEPRGRGIGYVPQDYALFPHLSVGQNIAFGLRVHGHEEANIDQITDLLGIGHLLSRSIDGLSGGEKQRVALARALVLKPKILLLDEPVCALDEVTRQQVCTQLSDIQRRFGLTTVHVSHNLEEAFSVADRAAVLHEGLLRQAGTLNELLRKPKNEFVARFMRCENILSAEAVGRGDHDMSTRVKLGDIELQIAGRHSSKLMLMIRPEDLVVRPAPDRYDTGPGSGYNGQGKNIIRARVVRSRDCGGYVRVELDGPVDLVAHITHAEFADLRQIRQPDVAAELNLKNIHVMPQ